MKIDTDHPCFGESPLSLAERCERDGLIEHAQTIRGLLEEREALRKIVGADAGGEGMAATGAALADAKLLLVRRGVPYR
jgi:hypothetical protein